LEQNIVPRFFKLLYIKVKQDKFNIITAIVGWGINFENINFDSCKILASTWLLGPTKY
jgi:hypothetical protein